MLPLFAVIELFANYEMNHVLPTVFRDAFQEMGHSAAACLQCHRFLR